MATWNVSRLLAEDRDHLLHPLYHPDDHAKPHVWVRGKGAVPTDAEGREFLDGLSCLWNVNVGHGRRELAEWVSHIRHAPQVALHVADDIHVQHTRVLVQGLAEMVEGPVAPAESPTLNALTERLSLRYLGPNGPTYAARTARRPRVLVRITPTRWRTWTGQEWHPRYR